MGKEAIPDGAAEFYPDPRCRVRVVDIDAEDEWTRQADDANKAQGRDHAHARDGPEIGDDFGDPALPQRPCRGPALSLLLGAQSEPERGDKSEKSGALMADFVDQG